MHHPSLGSQQCSATKVWGRSTNGDVQQGVVNVNVNLLQQQQALTSQIWFSEQANPSARSGLLKR